MRPGPIDRTRESRVSLLGVFLASILLHLFLIFALIPLWPHLTSPDPAKDSVPVSLIIQVPEMVPEVPQDPDLRGQIVDVAQPEEPAHPQDANFLAEHNQRVEIETRTERYRINPEVLAPQFSREDKLQYEDLTDLDMTELSTGAQVGNDRFDPDEDGTLASLPSPFHVTNKEGLQRPVPASHQVQQFSGAPSNDLLDLPTGDSLALNTREILFAGYLNRIRRLVNFYWSQNIDNLPNSAAARLSRSSYRTGVYVVLDDGGALESVDITQESGSKVMDYAVLAAFRIAGPFPNPPEQLIAKDGRVYLPDFEFTVNLGHARATYRGVDPRAGVQFPGILKVTR